MQRIVSLLLLPLCMLDGLFCPHVHVGLGADAPERHSARPHIHLSGGHHHAPMRSPGDHHRHGDHERHGIDHAHAAQEPASPGATSPLTNHDQDALYVAGPAGDGRPVVGNQTLSSLSTAFSRDCAGALNPRLRACAELSHPPDKYGGLPLYLRVSSLRI